MKKLFWLILPALILTACPKPEPKPPKILPKDDRSLCEKSCDHIQSLDCPEGNDLVYPVSCSTDEDCTDGICTGGKCTETCKMVCEALVDQGRQLGLECWQTITECEQIESVCR